MADFPSSGSAISARRRDLQALADRRDGRRGGAGGERVQRGEPDVCRQSAQVAARAGAGRRGRHPGAGRDQGGPRSGEPHHLQAPAQPTGAGPARADAHARTRRPSSRRCPSAPGPQANPAPYVVPRKRAIALRKLEATGAAAARPARRRWPCEPRAVTSPGCWPAWAQAITQRLAVWPS